MTECLHDYDFVAPQKVAFGWGRLREVAALSKSMGRRAFLVQGSRRLAEQGVTARITEDLGRNGVSVVELAFARREPQVADVDLATQFLRSHKVQPGDFVIALGGGSSIDLAKAAAAMATNSGSVADYLEGVGAGRTLDCAPLPILAIPTTAGTGSEATKNAVISSESPPFKKSLRSEQLVPRVVLVDPELTVSLPRELTIQTGMDAITQLIESYISRRARPIPQALALQGLALALPAIRQAASEPSSRPAREAMAHAALLSGMALANSGLGMAHGVAAALGIHLDVPHGLACAVMLPVALRVNASAARPAIAELGRATLGEAGADEVAAERFTEHVEQLCTDLTIPRNLRSLGVTPEKIPVLVASSRGNSMSGNPRELSDRELASILEQCL